jgi:cellulose biosynthesis protein BcsQ
MRGVEGQIWKLLREEILPIAGLYDYVIFDCAPGISPVNEVAIRASDIVIVPTIPDLISTLGLNAFCRSLWGTNHQGALPRPRQLPYVLVTRYQQQVRQHQETLQGMHVEIAEPDAGFCLFRTKIPQAAALAEAMTMVGDTPTFRSKYGTTICDVLDDLVQELKGYLDGNRH